MNEDGTNRERLFESPAAAYGTVSPDGEWLSSIAPDNASVILYGKNRQQRLYPYTAETRMRWTHDGSRAYVSLQYGQPAAFLLGRTFVLPLATGAGLPVPPDGFRDEAEIAAVPGVMSIPHGDVALGNTPGVYAYSRLTTTSNLYRIPLQ